MRPSRDEIRKMIDECRVKRLRSEIIYRVEMVHNNCYAEIAEALDSDAGRAFLVQLGRILRRRYNHKLADVRKKGD